MVQHGRSRTGRRPRLKLTDAQVAEIRALKGIKSHTEIGKMFGVTDSHVRKIQQGITRDPSTYVFQFFTPEEEAAIRKMLAERVPREEIAKRLGRTVGSVEGKIRRILYPPRRAA